MPYVGFARFFYILFYIPDFQDVMNRLGTAFGQVTGEFSFIKVPVLFSVIVVTKNSGSNSKNRFATGS